MRIDGLLSSQLANVINNTDILSKLNIGDVVRAQILDFMGNDVLLKLLDGVTVKAATTTQIDAKQGDYVEFFVKARIDNQLVLETVKSPETDADNEIQNQLSLIGVKADDSSMEIAKQIKYNGLPFTREIFDNISNMIEKFSSLDASKSAFLLSNQLSPDENTISTLNSFAEGKSQLGSNLKELLNLIDLSSDARLLSQLGNELEAFDKSTKPNISTGKQAVETTAAPKSTNPVSSSITEFVSNKINSIENPVLKNAFEILNSSPKLAEFIETNINETNNLNSKVTNYIKAQPSDSDLTAKISNFIKTQLPDFEKLNQNDKQNAADFIKDMFIGIKRNVYPDGYNRTDDKLQDQDNLKNAVRKSFDGIFIKLDSDSLDKEPNIKNTYKELYSKLEIVKDAVLQSNALNTVDIRDKIENIQNNIRFLNELNNYSTYVQIPLTIQGQNTTGNLYIMKKDARRKKIDPENVTMLISLDTQNIGQVDSLISVSKRNISVNMRVEDQRLFDLIKEGYKDLYNSLSRKGYKLVDLKYKLLEEKSNLLNFKELAKKELERSRQSVDYRI